MSICGPIIVDDQQCVVCDTTVLTPFSTVLVALVICSVYYNMPCATSTANSVSEHCSYTADGIFSNLTVKMEAQNTASALFIPLYPPIHHSESSILYVALIKAHSISSVASHTHTHRFELAILF